MSENERVLLDRISELEKTNKHLTLELETLRGNKGQRFKEKYATKILDSLPDMLTVLTHSGKFVDLVSSESSNHVGEPSCKLIGRNISTMLPTEAYINVKHNLDRVVATNEGSISNHTLTVNGIEHYYENRIFPLDEENLLCICRDVTDATESHMKLEQTNKRMKLAEGIASLSHWHYYTNKQELKMPGIIPALLGKDKNEIYCSLTEYLKHVHSEDRSKLNFFKTDKINPKSYQEHRLYINDELRYFHTRTICVREEDGEQIVEGYIQDVTDVIERVRELEIVKYAVNNAEEEIYACSLDGTIVFANNKFISHHNLKENISDQNYKIYGLNNSSFSVNEWSQLISNIKKENGSYKCNIRQSTDDKVDLVYEIMTYIIKNDSDEDLVWLFARNISIRVAQQKRIKELNQVMDAILNNIPVYLFVKDTSEDFRYLYWNKAFAEHAKISAADAIGKTDYEVFPLYSDADRFRKDDLALIKKGSDIEFEENYQSADGVVRTVHTIKSLIQLENRPPWIIGISWDITNIKRVEKELINAREKAVESDRLKSAFLANMSHEIRTPLNAIVGFSKLLSEVEDSEEKQQYSGIIDSNAELLLQLINDILDLSKIEAGTLEFINKEVNLSDMCREVYEVFNSRLNGSVTLFYDESPDVEIYCDNNRLLQVITNLITNAIKFTPVGEIRFGYIIKENSNIEFYVKDTGLGIPKDKIGAIFTRFTKLNSFAQGTGLGLSICRTIIDKMGGDIWAESEYSIGSQFYFTIPYSNILSRKNTVSDYKKTETRLKENQKDKKNVLIAEDIDSNFMLAKAALGKNFNVIRALNGLEAVDIFKKTDLDIIIMDIKMPVMDGLTATKEIRKISETIPIIALTSFAFEVDKQDALNSGCNDFITKPIAVDSFADIITKFIL